MAGLGHTVIAVLTPGATELAQRASDLGLEVVTVPVRLPYLDVPAGRKLRKLIRSRGVDLLLVARSKDLSTAILGATNDTAVVLYNQMQSGVAKNDWLHNRIYRRLDAAINITERQRHQLLSTTGIDPSKIYFAPYGVDHKRFSPDAMTSAEARRTFDIPDSAFVVGIVGGFDAGKGQHHLLEGLRIASQQDSSLQKQLWGLFVGERKKDAGVYTTDLRAIRDSLHFRKRVIFAPFLDNPVVAYRAMDVFVLASHSETFGMVAQEAMSCECAVIATDAGGVPEIITTEVDGLLIPPESPQGIADAIVRLWRDPGLRGQLAGRGRRTCIERYDPEKSREKFISILEEALRQRRTTAIRSRPR